MTTTHHALLIALVYSLSMAFPSAAAERQMMPPRVPSDKLTEARALKSPLPDSTETVERGKALYEGRARVSIATGPAAEATGWRRSDWIPRLATFTITGSGATPPKESSSG